MQLYLQCNVYFHIWQNLTDKKKSCSSHMYSTDSSVMPINCGIVSNPAKDGFSMHTEKRCFSNLCVH